MRQLWEIAWQRFSVNSAVIADINGRFIATMFYFTILVPFGLLSSIFMDPLSKKPSASMWLRRDPVPTDISAAKEQG